MKNVTVEVSANEFVMAKLVSVKGGWSTVIIDGEERKVRNGQVSEDGLSELDQQSMTQYGHTHCPGCGIGLDNGVVTNGDECGDGTIISLSHEFGCMGCGHEFGKKIKSRKSYPKTKGDEVSLMLDGQTRNTIARTAAKHLDGWSAQALLDKYAHLDNGRFRMVIGNRLRKALA